MSRLLYLLAVALLSFPVMAEPEKFYQDIFCQGKGEAEYTLSDKTRVDCLTLGYAIEVDFARKAWSEGVGQALHYAKMTGKQPGVVIIMESASDCKYLHRLTSTIDYMYRRIDYWEVGPYAGKCQ